MRRNPVEYRRQQSNLRMEERRMHTYPKSNSIEGSRSLHSNQGRKRNQNKSERRLRRKHRRRRKRAAKNCGTRQPPYQWKQKKLHTSELDDNKKYRYNKVILFFNS